mmetsp:Transcript_36416/g.114933  ORF Transcript_36416/g.114933 Transcript_36416/m.114933 type:complete len:405 (-) Transcript_36416:110-1324(-)
MATLRGSLSAPSHALSSLRRGGRLASRIAAASTPRMRPPSLARPVLSVAAQPRPKRSQGGGEAGADAAGQKDDATAAAAASLTPTKSPSVDLQEACEEEECKVPLKVGAAPMMTPQLAFDGRHRLRQAILTVSCEDSVGIIGTVTSFLHMHGANVEDCRTHSTQGGTFNLRLAFTLPEDWFDVLSEAFDAMVAGPYNMTWNLRWSDQKKRMAVLCSKEDHALMEILWASRRGDLPVEIVAVISNHDNLRAATESLGFAFHQVSITKENKSEAEAKIKELCQGSDLAVLARYMQILSEDFLSGVPFPVINIHHSFLPSFKGANPYQQAFDKGVRLIGATAHYVTPDLDEGPIIEQDVERISHRMSVPDLRATGRAVECKVLHRAVKWHLEDRVFRVEGNRTIVFN